MNDIHPKLSRTAWNSLVDLSERKINDTNTDSQGFNNREGDFENFIPKLMQIVKQPFPRIDSQAAIEDLHLQKRQSL